ncbi:glycosyltransferase family 4 protein [Vannielia sp.]|uniref:glycosyltransferase family 4 protein n=1 Tax=Vannielia sp. TaxID=2813045 RepID=UPI00262359E7|nr:glycosyltransferase family 4 protein [Vannielia sp.]MDF1872307.1 glycosyltransferase family 4 protein [Vannielia sp.]
MSKAEPVNETLLRRAFDGAYYLSQNPDVAIAGLDPLDHYMASGWREGRPPAPWFDAATLLSPQQRRRTRQDPALLVFLEGKSADDPTLEGRLAEQPLGKLTAAFDSVFDPVSYLEQNPDVAGHGMDAREHYLKAGWREGRRAALWFDAEQWCGLNPDLDPVAVNPFLHFISHAGIEAGGEDPQEKWLHLTGISAESSAPQYVTLPMVSTAEIGDDEAGARRPIVVEARLPRSADLDLMRAHFDPDYYRATNPDLPANITDPLLHFATVGWIEGRDPCAEFSVSFYLKENRDLASNPANPFLDFLRHGHREHWRRAVSVREAQILNSFSEPGAMKDRLDAAKALDPMVAMPPEKRMTTSPTLSAKAPADAVEAIREALGGRRYRYIVAVPHVRMSGASRVASIFATALARVRRPQDILVITTDSSEAEYIGWFPDEIDRLNLSTLIEHLSEEQRQRALIDLLRGCGAQAVINVNSRLMWETLEAFGRQLASEMKVVTYLFTWDETPDGDRVGYPIQWLRHTCNHHHVLLTDTKALARDVSERFGYGVINAEGAEGAEVLALHTPASDSGVRAVVAGRNAPKRVLWAGRFDRQKRVDILVEIARANPQITFDVYGKAVLSEARLPDFDPPENIIEKGTYSTLQEVLETPYSAFLYTAQWDGLPTILLDMAAARLPIIAPDLGGIGEMLDDSTGWLIEDFTDIDAYTKALKQATADPAGAREKADALAERVAATFAESRYEAEIEGMLKRHEL